MNEWKIGCEIQTSTEYLILDTEITASKQNKQKTKGKCQKLPEIKEVRKITK